MTREEIIRLAREAGLESYGPTPSAPESYGVFVDCVERFAALVERRAAAAEREACALVCKTIRTNGDMAECWLEIAAAAIRARSKP